MSFVVRDFMTCWNVSRQRSEPDRHCVCFRVAHDGVMVLHQIRQCFIDGECRVQSAEVALGKGPFALWASRVPEQELNVMLSSRHLVEEVDVVDVRASIDEIVLVPFEYVPHISAPPWIRPERLAFWRKPWKTAKMG